MKNHTFEKSIKFRKWGIIFMFLTPTYVCLRQDMIGGIIILFVSFYFDSQYKCPFCNKAFDTRIEPDELEYCPRCGEKLS